jgi:hypothetical protein
MGDAVFKVSTDSFSEVIVELSGNAANVMLVDGSNYRSYLSRGRFRYQGGFFRQSPATFRPGAGEWYVIVNLPGGGRTHAEVSVRG